MGGAGPRPARAKLCRHARGGEGGGSRGNHGLPHARAAALSTELRGLAVSVTRPAADRPRVCAVGGAGRRPARAKLCRDARGGEGGGSRGNHGFPHAQAAAAGLTVAGLPAEPSRGDQHARQAPREHDGDRARLRPERASPSRYTALTISMRYLSGSTSPIACRNIGVVGRVGPNEPERNAIGSRIRFTTAEAPSAERISAAVASPIPAKPAAPSRTHEHERADPARGTCAP